MSRLVISAFGVHSGGGMVLLRALLRAASGRIAAVFLDARAAGALAGEVGQARVVAVAPTVASRVGALWHLGGAAKAGDRLLCFNGLPPLRAGPARTVAFVQARYLCAGGLADYPYRIAARISFERALFRLGVRHCDELWVQTPTMADALRPRATGVPVRAMPFAEHRTSGPPPPAGPARDRSFFYPADGARPKNHRALLRAWALLAGEGLRPPLRLTVGADVLANACGVAGIDARALPHVHALGWLPHAAVLDRLGTDTLIFPSLSESFGLPLVEARARGTAILATETPFVRDVCVPLETFDAASPRSIADAVRRAIGVARPPIEPLSPGAFVEALFA